MSIIYKTTCLINNKIYIGQSINNNPNYLGSGNLILNSIKKYGKINFKKEIIMEGVLTQEELDFFEIKYIREFNSTDRNIGYNILTGGGGYSKMVLNRKQKDNYKTCKIKEYETKKNNSEEYNNTKLKISNTLKGSIWVNKNGLIKLVKKEDYNFYLSDGWLKGKLHIITYKECSDIAKKLNIRSIKEWRKISKFNNLPCNPDRKFKQEWCGWNLFLQK